MPRKTKVSSRIKTRPKGKITTVKPMELAADKYHGAFEINKWPENLDKLALETMKKWANQTP